MLLIPLFDVLQYLSKKKNLGAAVDHANEKGETALMKAASNGHWEVKFYFSMNKIFELVRSGISGCFRKHTVTQTCVFRNSQNKFSIPCIKGMRIPDQGRREGECQGWRYPNSVDVGLC